jgi:hypothetical protein
MNTSPCQCTSDGKKLGRLRPALAFLALATAMSDAQAAQEQTQQPQTQARGPETAAVLKQQELDFFYRSSVAPFSCVDIKGRVASIMRYLGARDDINVTVNGCDAMVTPMDNPADPWQNQNPNNRWGTSAGDLQTSGNSRWTTSSSSAISRQPARPEQSSHVRVRLMMPVEVTPEILDQMQKDKSRRELISRVTGNANTALNDPIVFPAQRRLVALDHRALDLEPDECELLEQMSTSIFRKLNIRVVSRGPRCDRNEISHMPPQMTVEALMPVMPPTPQLTPAPAASEPDPGAPGASATEPPAQPAPAQPKE